ncbi:hypothetical protein MKW92_011780, partial [Papaver armeniacum]
TQCIKHIIALCRNVEDAQPSSTTLHEVAWKLENYHRNELLAEFGEISQEPSQSLTNQRDNSQHVAESEDIEQRGVQDPEDHIGQFKEMYHLFIRGKKYQIDIVDYFS